MMKNENGFTLAEVMVAFIILLAASQLLISGAAAARKLECRANELSGAAEMLRENLADDSNCISGTVRMKIDEDTELISDGWLYQGGDLSPNEPVVRVVRIEEGS